MTGDTGASGTTGMLALETSRVSVAVLDTQWQCDFCLRFHTALLLRVTQAW